MSSETRLPIDHHPGRDIRQVQRTGQDLLRRTAGRPVRQPPTRAWAIRHPLVVPAAPASGVANGKPLRSIRSKASVPSIARRLCRTAIATSRTPVAAGARRSPAGSSSSFSAVSPVVTLVSILNPARRAVPSSGAPAVPLRRALPAKVRTSADGRRRKELRREIAGALEGKGQRSRRHAMS